MSLPISETVTRVLECARQEARTLGHDHLGTEHVLLGLVGEETSLAAVILGRLAIPLPHLRLQVGLALSAVPPTIASHALTMTPGLRRALAYADEEAQGFQHDAVEAEHLLLGLLRESEGVAAGVLARLGVTTIVVRRLVAELTGRASLVESIQGQQPPVARPASPLPSPAPPAASAPVISTAALLDGATRIPKLKRIALAQQMVLGGLMGVLTAIVLIRLGVVPLERELLPVLVLLGFGLGVEAIRAIIDEVREKLYQDAGGGPGVSQRLHNLEHRLWERQICLGGLLCGLLTMLAATVFNGLRAPERPLNEWLCGLTGLVVGSLVSASGRPWLGGAFWGVLGVSPAALTLFSPLGRTDAVLFTAISLGFSPFGVILGVVLTARRHPGLWSSINAAAPSAGRYGMPEPVNLPAARASFPLRDTSAVPMAGNVAEILGKQFLLVGIIVIALGCVLLRAYLPVLEQGPDATTDQRVGRILLYVLVGGVALGMVPVLLLGLLVWASDDESPGLPGEKDAVELASSGLGCGGLGLILGGALLVAVSLTQGGPYPLLNIASALTLLLSGLLGFSLARDLERLSRGFFLNGGTRTGKPPKDTGSPSVPGSEGEKQLHVSERPPAESLREEQPPPVETGESTREAGPL